MGLNIIKYNPEFKRLWDSFVSESHNGTFLFFRDYMEYHSDRFKDHSLLIFENNDLLALIPANSTAEEKFISHGGLTYGGLIHNHKIKSVKMLEVFDILISYLKHSGFNEFVYKCIPHIYHIRPTEEDLYALFRFNFSLFRRDISSAVNLFSTSIPGKKRNRYNKGLKENLEIKESYDTKNLLEIIKENLMSKYGVLPVHNFIELNLLKKHFPDNIKIFEVYLHNELIGGTILYISNCVVHVQYMTATDKGFKFRIFDFLFTYLFEIYQKTYQWFDFGISTERDGQFLNNGLIEQKEGFNATGVCYDFYKLDL
jgi:hypothetical protein